MNSNTDASAGASSRQPACEPCRRSKLACDHQLPSCTRCQRLGKDQDCTYRQSPFKRRRTNNNRPSPEELRSPPPETPTSSSTTFVQNAYPHPGYLGDSSHRSMFQQISPEASTITSNGCDRVQIQRIRSHRPHHDTPTLVKRGAGILERALTSFDSNQLRGLIEFWLSKGVNLALAEPFVKSCCEAFWSLGAQPDLDSQWFIEQSRNILANSMKPFEVRPAMTALNFIAQTCGSNLRWESLGIFFSAIVRASFDISFFPGLYKDDEQKYALRSFAAQLSDELLELCLSMDCMNDFQLVLQYENFILHSHVDGDHSYQSWRKLGDVITSLYALGYHQKIDSEINGSLFLSELRRTALARVYSADKNVAIFLGRPPRMTKRFCQFQTPLSMSSLPYDPKNQQEQDMYTWPLDAPPSYRVETRWSALCAYQKEEILELFSAKRLDGVTRKADKIHARCVRQWEALPADLKLTGSLKNSSKDPFKRDLLVSIRLNYLHVLFFIRLLCQDRAGEPGDTIVEISENMLNLVTEAILFRDKLNNSGTGLAWKVAYYGLPATGTILLKVLARCRQQNTGSILKPSVLRNLHIFVAEVEAGAIVQATEANYALLSQAVQTIRIFLDSITYGVAHHSTETFRDFESVQDPTQHSMRQLDLDTFEFEIGFWQNLADCSFVLDTDPGIIVQSDNI